MSDGTAIQWTDATWNPVSGCSKVSPGCKNCYAERDWARLSRNPKLKNYFGRPFTEVRCHPERLEQPLRWKKPRKIFVNSMSDLFHEEVPDEFIDRVFGAMAREPRHTYQILTKRPMRMREYLANHEVGARWAWAPMTSHVRLAIVDPGVAVGWTRNGLPNVWLGVSVENQQMADERIPMLLDTPAAVRFLSLEPLLEPVNLEWEWFDKTIAGYDRVIDWVIVGGESGPNARPCNIEWIRSIIAQCRAAGLPVFVKQLGAVPCQFNEGGPRKQIPRVFRNRLDRHGGDPAEWPVDLRVREFPAARA